GLKPKGRGLGRGGMPLFFPQTIFAPRKLLLLFFKNFKKIKLKCPQRGGGGKKSTRPGRKWKKKKRN
ncbi:hypothetical protein ACNITD_27670, partial [Escherichia coli]